MSFTYQPNVPVTGNTLNETKGPINSNFQAINQLIDVNHVGFNLTGLGKHNLVELVAQSGTPATLVGEDSIFSQTSGGITDIYYTADDGGNAYQLTASDDAHFSTFGNITGTQKSGWTFLPGGLLVQYGNTAAVASSGSTTVTFPVEYTTAVYSLQCTVVTDSNATIRFSVEGTATTAGFTTTQTSTSHFTNLYWLAIGI